MVSRRAVVLGAPALLALAGTAGCSLDRASATGAAGSSSTAGRVAVVPAGSRASSTTSTASGATSTASGTPTTAVGPSPTSASTAAADASWAARSATLTDRLADFSVPAKVALGVALVDGTTGRSFAWHGTQRFDTASIVKVDILATLLLDAQDAHRGLSSTELALAQSMIRYSDNNAATALWDRIAEVSGLAAANRRLGLTSTTGGPSGYWGETRTTPRDQVRLIGQLASQEVVHHGHQALTLMTQVTPAQRWGVTSAARHGETVAVKNGWLPRSTLDYRWVINSIGRITGDGTDIRLAVLSRGHATMAAGVDVVEDLAALSRRTLGL